MSFEVLVSGEKRPREDIQIFVKHEKFALKKIVLGPYDGELTLEKFYDALERNEKVFFNRNCFHVYYADGSEDEILMWRDTTSSTSDDSMMSYMGTKKLVDIVDQTKIEPSGRVDLEIVYIKADAKQKGLDLEEWNVLNAESNKYKFCPALGFVKYKLSKIVYHKDFFFKNESSQRNRLSEAAQELRTMFEQWLTSVPENERNDARSCVITFAKIEKTTVMGKNHVWKTFPYPHNSLQTKGPNTAGKCVKFYDFAHLFRWVVTAIRPTWPFDGTDMKRDDFLLILNFGVQYYGLDRYSLPPNVNHIAARQYFDSLLS